jgi:hypothetical protein
MSNIPAIAEHIVRQSASMLDQVSPDWWTAERVNLGTLDIASRSNCLLAQSFGRIEAECACCSDRSYSVGLERVFDLVADAGLVREGEYRDHFAEMHGFAGGYIAVDREVFPDSEDSRVFIPSATFTAPWGRVIRERRDALISEAS